MDKVGVVGCGLMGSGIAEVCARAGASVVVIERDAEALKAGQARVERSLSRAVASGKVTEDEAEAARANLTYGDGFDDLADRDLLVEAVLEEERAKEEVFRHLDAVVRSEEAILATNTSSIPIIKLAMATRRPEQVIGMHFFNPVPVLKLVEVISSLLTSPETAACLLYTSDAADE